ncbi:MAG: hypothetical protein WKG07_29020 [Hymenobacter sp.]
MGPIFRPPTTTMPPAHLKRAALPGSLPRRGRFLRVEDESAHHPAGACLLHPGRPEGQFPTLRLLGIGVQVDRNLLAALDKVVDDEGRCATTPRRCCARLRQELIVRQGQLRPPDCRASCATPLLRAGCRPMPSRRFGAGGWCCR